MQPLTVANIAQHQLAQQYAALHKNIVIVRTLSC
jgi:hypothetical protein